MLTKNDMETKLSLCLLIALGVGLVFGLMLDSATEPEEDASAIEEDDDGPLF